MKIAVVGSRDFKEIELIKCTMYYYFKELHFGCAEKDTFISGGARGVDSLAEKEIDCMNTIMNLKINKRIFLPNWDKYGKSAGFIRNKFIVDEADIVLAFWDGSSKGTKHSIDLAVMAGKPVNIYIRN